MIEDDVVLGKKYFLPNSIYVCLKWVGLVLCPALAVFYGTIAPVWGMPYQMEVTATINAFGVLIGVLLGVSQVTSKEV